MRLITLLVCFSATSARAYTDSDIEQCARAAIGEVSWNHLDAMVAVTAVHRKRAEILGVSLGRSCVLYSAALRHPLTNRLWVRELTDSPNAPRHWPSHLPWERYRRRFRLVMEILRWYLSDLWFDRCQADHYGGPGDTPGETWERLDCMPGTRQRFYRVSS